MPDGNKPRTIDHATRDLRDRILSGALPSGMHLSETAAAEMLGMSRTPTREAMALLVEEGLLERSASGRCTVRALTRADVADAIELRGVLEGMALRLAAERGPEPDALAEAEACVEAIEEVITPGAQALDFERYATLNARFHAALARLPGSPLMERELLRAHRQPLASPSAFLGSQAGQLAFRRSLIIAQSQHRAMLAAVTAREGSRAEALGREHARLARQNFEDALSLDTGAEGHGIPGLALVCAEN
ncbi:GntR family transcriptional regulator [Vannielia litorea]|uniref:GntR family transcriptional regulator n=1 Tax=Vannielia litorea TaxID=1217970 RepID=UPI001C958AD7|nr:GntR family transcriptional regulator [Vannielia litorea]MBY6050058.1 GntR family transcriptional regulator [Vannielia litorea]MBY6077472.1 GntR family transcriptional regulator [Vannielia litorea]